MARILLGGRIVDIDLIEKVEIRSSSNVRFLYVEVLDYTNPNTGKQNLCIVEKQEDYNYIKRFMNRCHDDYCSFDGMKASRREEMNLYGLYLTPFVNCSLMFDYFVENCLYLVPSISDIYTKIVNGL